VRTPRLRSSAPASTAYTLTIQTIASAPACGAASTSTPNRMDTAPPRISSHCPRSTLRRRTAMAMSSAPVRIALAPITSTSTRAVRAGATSA
jgi:hypothetical protein